MVDPSGLVATAIATAFALAVAVYLSVNVSGGHLNPAVTFGMAIGGHITIPLAIFYWISQLLGSIFACMILRLMTVSQVCTHLLRIKINVVHDLSLSFQISTRSDSFSVKFYSIWIHFRSKKFH